MKSDTFEKILDMVILFFFITVSLSIIAMVFVFIKVALN